MVVHQFVIFYSSSFVENTTRNGLEQPNYIWIEVVVLPFLEMGRHFFAIFDVPNTNDSNPYVI